LHTNKKGTRIGGTKASERKPTRVGNGQKSNCLKLWNVRGKKRKTKSTRAQRVPAKKPKPGEKNWLAYEKAGKGGGKQDAPWSKKKQNPTKKKKQVCVKKHIQTKKKKKRTKQHGLDNHKTGRIHAKKVKKKHTGQGNKGTQKRKKNGGGGAFPTDVQNCTAAEKKGGKKGTAVSKCGNTALPKV